MNKLFEQIYSKSLKEWKENGPCELCGCDEDPCCMEYEEVGHGSKYVLCRNCIDDEDNYCPGCNGIIGLEVDNEDGYGECSGCGYDADYEYNKEYERQKRIQGYQKSGIKI